MQFKFKYQDTFPEVEAMLITEASTATLLKGIKTGRFDAVIDGIDPVWEESQLSSVLYMIDRLVIILPECWPLAQQTSVAIEELAAFPYIHVYTETDRNPVLLDPAITVDSIQKALQAVSEGNGFTVLPYERIKKHLPANVRLCELLQTPKLRFNLYFSKQDVRFKSMSILQHFLV